ncbi:hypothetical protein IV102_27515, partial [bacterium]|nr:hypothetical protein [bacterium]
TRFLKHAEGGALCINRGNAEQPFTPIILGYRYLSVGLWLVSLGFQFVDQLGNVYVLLRSKVKDGLTVDAGSSIR